MISLFADTSLLPQDGEANYIPQFFSPAESDLLFQRLQSEVPWKQEPILMFGKPILQPRLTAWYGDPNQNYRYSGIQMHPLPWNSTLVRIKEAAEQAAGIIFNGALLNLYRDGSDSMGWHSDDERELDKNPTIASVNFGATRSFRFRHRTDKKLKAAINLDHGSLLVMRGSTQHHWHHSIPKVKTPVSVRINITFRCLQTASY